MGSTTPEHYIRLVAYVAVSPLKNIIRFYLSVHGRRNPGKVRGRRFNFHELDTRRGRNIPRLSRRRPNGIPSCTVNSPRKTKDHTGQPNDGKDERHRGCSFWHASQTGSITGNWEAVPFAKVTLPVILGCPWSGVWVASETAAHSDVFFFSRANFFIYEGKVRVSELVLRFCFSSWLVMAHIDLKVALTGDDRSI